MPRMKNVGQKHGLAVILLALAPAAIAYAETSTSFARISTDEHERPMALQMSIVTYVPNDGDSVFSVDLVAAIHIGDPSYYAELNTRFRDYDAVLYELVAPQGTRARLE